MNKVACEKICSENFTNKRTNPFCSERVGMEQMMKLLGIEFEYEFNDRYEIIAVTINGQRVAA